MALFAGAYYTIYFTLLNPLDAEKKYFFPVVVRKSQIKWKYISN